MHTQTREEKSRKPKRPSPRPSRTTGEAGDKKAVKRPTRPSSYRPRTTAASTEPVDRLAQVFTPSLLPRVYSFWFQHVEKDENFTLPTQETFQRWFSRDPEFDLGCINEFESILEAIRKEGKNATADRIIELANPRSALDWLSLVILLDQIPRNCYRDAKSAVVFKFFDTRARRVTFQAFNAGVLSSPEIRYRMALRFWFYLPLMHSESLRMHAVAMRKYREMESELLQLLEAGRRRPEGGAPVAAEEVDDEELEPKQLENEEEEEEEVEDEVQDDFNDKLLERKEFEYAWMLGKNPEAVKALCALLVKTEGEHREIIARFGRYPHRNQALQRTTKPEEEKFLAENQSFGG
ncbi:hypothetical protein P175DRAFT_0511802 [Aspergillus ochraceoroseus IBT 24754]|uniref:DUF924-domain-containing protein n=2 Tax=Aspergillus ochraceoroseus TaxID=138278 RepID=A0A2T5LQ28_9EURO|nr:uncharacterized protein P175DRAFT_0511802 [Aspergillus ochraceoroseus IBT 24754]KKK22727.1 hypothetical protein AOCH_004164 [Aspergillus ochraceoroseus]PTU18381.1 hypothetical protein P175DRAFT_0511802 [Aspergillus ochraceoroseus IBT 24754]